MKNLVFLPLFLFCCWQASSQDYLQQANACFDKGDYECAVKYYNLFKELDGSKDVNAQIKKSQECMGLFVLADGNFFNKEYGKASEGYKAVLDKNPKDPNAKRQYDLCAAQLNRSVSNTSTPQVSSTNTQRHPAEPEMVFVQGGAFWMGCSSEQGGDCSLDESPLHNVTVSSFYIGKYEVTQKQWQLIMGTTVRQQRDKAGSSLAIYGEGDNYPMYYVSWDEAQEFIRRLSEATGKQYRLATEAEWEYAARGGNKRQGYKYSGSNNPNDVAWFSDNSGSATHPVGTKAPNELGIYDMSGNVYEWCYDWYGTYPSSPQRDPQGPSSGSYRVFRGGSWGSGAGGVRVSDRGDGAPGRRYDDLGFRLACSSN